MSTPPVQLTPPGIRAVHLRRFFGKVPAVVDISFDAPAGAITGLVGPNGSGKTTLLLMLAGLLRPDAGNAWVGGYHIASQASQARAATGWMPDVSGTWDALTCFEILTFFGRAYGMSPADTEARVKYLLGTMYLVEFADQPARVLSRGQKQRLGLARALIHDPQILLLDEPAAGLDPRSRVELRDLLRSLAAAGKTILLSSHVLAEMDDIVDSAVFISAGSSVDSSTTSAALALQTWRLGAADQAGLTQFLDAHGVAWQANATHPGEVTVALASPDDATALLRDLVGAGIDIHTIAPSGGRLEDAYLALNEERV
ncbi:MAG: ABC transporter ATP-binding protein [Propionibacteriaceae bacterium]|nr:ABC transporter ATP-binding protein [Propionibacteriaceae bacterium]